MSHLHCEQPLPFSFKSFQQYELKIDSKFTIVESKPAAHITIKLATGKEITLHHTSLYKVDYLRYKSEKINSYGYLWQLHREESDRPCSLENKYVWGCELIYGLKNQSIEKLEVSEQVTYF